MATSQYLPFGTGSGANVMSYSTYSALTARSSGFGTGTAYSIQCNTVWRQTSVAAAALALFTADNSTLDVLDDGDVPGFADKVKQAVVAIVTGLNNTNPRGTVIQMTGMAGQTRPTPAGYVYANGANVPRTGIYQKLWEYYGSPNTGDGATTWTLPDLRGVFLRNLDDGRGLDTGRVIGSQQAPSVQAHKHVTTAGEAAATSSSAWPFGRTASAGRLGFNNPDTDNHWHYTNDGADYDGTLNAAGVITNETRPVNVAVWPFIKL